MLQRIYLQKMNSATSLPIINVFSTGERSNKTNIAKK